MRGIFLIQQEFDVIVVGAGMSGLAAAARLASAGVRTELIERLPQPGGKCSTRRINGCIFDIGALYVGSRAVELLRNTFQLALPARPVRVGVRWKESWITLPPGFRMLKDLFASGVNPLELASFCFNLHCLFGNKLFARSNNLGEVIEKLSSNSEIREVLFAGVGVSGVNPYRLPSGDLQLGRHAPGTRIGAPLALEGGNGQLADQLLDFYLHAGGHACLGKKVDQITPKMGHWQVISKDETYGANAIISTVGVKATLLDLTRSEIWPQEYYRSVVCQEDTLEVVNLFIQFSSTEELPRRYGIYFLPNQVADQFAAFKQGKYPPQPMYVLQVPGRRSDDGKLIGATLQFYHPATEESLVTINQQVSWILSEGLEQLSKGLSRRVVSCEVYPPSRYEHDFGLKPFVFGIAPITGEPRLSVSTPLPGLFLAGDSVEPLHPSVPQAIESGLIAADKALNFLKQNKVANHE